MGGGKTCTLLHRDVCEYTQLVCPECSTDESTDCSYSISTSIVGRKRWTLFPPECSPDLQPFIRDAEYTDSRVDVRLWTRSTWETFQSLGAFEVVQEPGETIFIPSGWYHQVENLSSPVTLSLNHNWANAHNLPTMYNAMHQERDAVEVALGDVHEMLASSGRPEEDWRTEWEECVSRVLTSNAGWR